MIKRNFDEATVGSFGEEWSRFNQEALVGNEAEAIFAGYFGIFPWEILPIDSVGFDMGCGSGRWANFVAPKVGTLNCVDPSSKALEVAKKKLSVYSNVHFFEGTANDKVLELKSQDFGYSLGVLHHIPDTELALKGCIDMLKPGAPFLLYLYYGFDNRPVWFRAIWRLSEVLRGIISRLPDKVKPVCTDIIASLIYWPMARLSKALSALGFNVDKIPLSFYKNSSFYTMRTDARDRFGTPLEQRFTRIEIVKMMEAAGLENITFSDDMPYWVSVGYKV